MVKGGICNKIVITEMKYFLLDYDSYDVCYHWVMSPVAFVLSTWTFNDGLLVSDLFLDSLKSNCFNRTDLYLSRLVFYRWMSQKL